MKSIDETEPIPISGRDDELANTTNAQSTPPRTSSPSPSPPQPQPDATSTRPSAWSPVKSSLSITVTDNQATPPITSIKLTSTKLKVDDLANKLDKKLNISNGINLNSIVDFPHISQSPDYVENMDGGIITNDSSLNDYNNNINGNNTDEHILNGNPNNDPGYVSHAFELKP
jgi:hypothetical protein